MSLITISIILAVIVLAYNIARALSPGFKKATAWISVIGTILFIASLALSALLYLDFKDMVSKFQTSDNLFLYDNNNNIEIGLSVNTQNSANILEGIKPLPAEELIRINQAYKAKDYKSMLGSNYKIFIVKKQLFEDKLPAEMQFMNTTITKQEVLTLLSSETSLDIFAGIAARNLGIPDIAVPLLKDSLLKSINIDNSDEFRSMMFIFAFFSGVSGNQGNPLASVGIIEEYKKGNLVIYPETVLFKVMKLVPESVYSQLMPAK